MAEKTITRIDSGRSFAIHVGDVLNLELPEILGTGYSWEPVETAAAILRVIKSEHKPGSSMPGAPGTKIYRFEATARGDGRIELALRRPWEPVGTRAESFVVRISVQ